MKPQSSKNDPTPQTTTFGAKIRTRIGCWNVRTLARPERLPQAAKVMRDYNIHILGLSEVRWNGFGETTADYESTLLYSGKEDEEASREYGVGLLLSRSAKSSLLHWKPVSERIITARFNSRVRKITIVQCYAPTNSASQETKTQFYDQLQATVGSIKKQDIVILMGELNAKNGNNNIDREHFMGKHATPGEMNENGELFGDFCSTNGLVIGGTLFSHKECHKVTWISPDGVTRNQIDHISISKSWKSSLLDVRNKRGADIDSDHHLVLAEMRLKIAAVHRKSEKVSRKFNIAKLKAPATSNAFTISLRNQFELLEELEDEQLDEHWVRLRTAFVKAGEETLGFSSSTKKPWMSTELWDAIEERQNVKCELLANCNDADAQNAVLKQKYADLRTSIKRLARRDRRQVADELAEQANRAARRKDMRSLYEATKTLSGKKSSSAKKPLRSSDGQLLCTTDEQLRRWHEHFSELLTRCQSATNDDDRVATPTTMIDIPITPPTFDEVVKAIKQLKSGKAPGIDNISIELLKADAVTSAELLLPLLIRIWETESVPMEWKEGLLVKVPKKGDLSSCDNWRGITVLPAAAKVLAKILLNRMSPEIEKTLREEQAGFRPGRSCTDHINTLRIIIEQCVEWQAEVYLGFVDFEKAFDTVKWSALWQSLERRGVPSRVVNIIKSLYRNSTCRVVHEQTMSEPIRITAGVKQGCLLSPLLFIILIDDIMREVVQQPSRGLDWGSGTLDDLDYADDLVLISPTLPKLQAKLRSLQEAARRSGLRINARKTVDMRVFPSNVSPVLLDNNPLDTVNSFSYLGSAVTNTGGSDEDIEARIKKAKAVFAQLRPVWQSNVLTRRIKLSLFESIVKSVLLYGCETWRVTKGLTNKIQVFINKSLRTILRIFWPNTISNVELWSKCQQTPIAQEISLRKWRWIGHTLRREENSASIAFEWQPGGRRRRGRPTHTWRRSVDKELKEAGLSWSDAREIARDRPAWRKLIEALCTSGVP